MHGPINVKSLNNTSKWQMGFNSAFKGLTAVLYSSALCSLQRSISPPFHYTFFFVPKLLAIIKHSSSPRKFSIYWNYVLRHRLHKALLLLPLLNQFGPLHSTTSFSKICLYFYFTHKQRVYPWQTSTDFRPEVITASAMCSLAGAKSRSTLP
jgi:hypothetical protein